MMKTKTRRQFLLASAVAPLIVSRSILPGVPAVFAQEKSPDIIQKPASSSSLLSTDGGETVTLRNGDETETILNHRYKSTIFLQVAFFVCLYSNELWARVDDFNQYVTKQNDKTYYSRLKAQLADFSGAVYQNVSSKANNNQITYSAAEVALYNVMTTKLQAAINTYNAISDVNNDIIVGMENLVGVSANFLKALSHINYLRSTNSRADINIDVIIKNGFTTFTINGNYVLNKPTNLYSVDRNNVEIVVIPYPSANYRPAAMTTTNTQTTTRSNVQNNTIPAPGNNTGIPAPGNNTGIPAPGRN
jgi:hypothetical protein